MKHVVSITTDLSHLTVNVDLSVTFTLILIIVNSSGVLSLSHCSSHTSHEGTFVKRFCVRQISRILKRKEVPYAKSNSDLPNETD
jgi:hypothetical protein